VPIYVLELLCFAFEILHRERTNKVFGKRFARLLKIVTTAHLPPNYVASRANRLCRLQQWQFVVVNPPAKAQYVFCDLIYFLSMYPKFLAMLFILSSLFCTC
jgi:hypothetical protein